MRILIISAVVGCGAIFACIQFLVVPVVSEWKSNSKQAKEIQERLQGQREIIRKRSDLQSSVDNAREKIQSLSQYIPKPVLGNYLLGMDKHIRNCVGNLDVNILRINDNDILSIGDAENAFRIYRVNVSISSDYDNFIRFVRNIQESNPFVSIMGLEIVPQPDTPQIHSIYFLVGWVIWTSEEKMRTVLENDEKSSKQDAK